MGWIVAAALGGVMVGTGFQGNSSKIGTVDMARVFNESDFAKKETDQLHNLAAARQGVLEFLQSFRTLKPEDSQKFKDLSLNASPSAADKAEIERIKSEAKTDDQSYRDLTTKQNPTAADNQLLEEYNKRTQQNTALLGRWQQEFTTELSGQQDTMHKAALDKVKAAVKQIGAAQGYTMILVDDVAPYSANDITDEALKTMNKK